MSIGTPWFDRFMPRRVPPCSHSAPPKVITRADRVVEVICEHPGAARHVLLVSLDWTRDKDPRVPLGHGSLVAALAQAGAVQVTGRSWSLSRDGFSAADVTTSILEWARGRSPERLDVGFGVYVWNDRYVRVILQDLRAAGFAGRIFLGGPQISYAAPGLETLYPEADGFLRGYAEDALVSVTRTADRVHVPGVVWAGGPDTGVPAEVDLERLPSPFLTGVIPVPPGARFVRWETQRGCPYRCSFCQHREAGARLRRRGLQEGRVMREIERFVAAGVQEIAVLDPIFNAGPRYMDILEKFHQLGFTGRLALQCRFELVTDGFIELCAKLDVKLEFGLQTIHPDEGRAVRRVNKPDKVRAVMDRLNARGIFYEVSLIYGLPCQTLGSFRQTVDFCLRHRVPVLKAFPLMLLRGTELDRERHRWNLVESDDPIPAVIAGSTFSVADRARMQAIAEVLASTEGCHPSGIEALEQQMAGRKKTPPAQKSLSRNPGPGLKASRAAGAHSSNPVMPVNQTLERHMSMSKNNSNPPSQADLDNHANQHNTNSEAHKAAQDNRANQLNHNHPADHSSRSGNQKK